MSVCVHVCVCVCLLGRDEGKEAASAQTQSHREGQSKRQAGKATERIRCEKER